MLHVARFCYITHVVYLGNRSAAAAAADSRGSWRLLLCYSPASSEAPAAGGRVGFLSRRHVAGSFLSRRHVAALVRCISDSLARHRAASPASRLIPSGAPRLTPPVSESSPRYHILPRRRPWYFFEARSAEVEARSAESKFSLRTDLRSLSAASSAPAHARNSARTAALTRDGRRPWYFFEARTPRSRRGAPNPSSRSAPTCARSPPRPQRPPTRATPPRPRRSRAARRRSTPARHITAVARRVVIYVFDCF